MKQIDKNYKNSICTTAAVLFLDMLYIEFSNLFYRQQKILNCNMKYILLLEENSIKKSITNVLKMSEKIL